MFIAKHEASEGVELDLDALILLVRRRSDAEEA
jgi:hypothetical protein